jgi:hypothetical protein
MRSGRERARFAGGYGGEDFRRHEDAEFVEVGGVDGGEAAVFVVEVGRAGLEVGVDEVAVALDRRGGRFGTGEIQGMFLQVINTVPGQSIVIIRKPPNVRKSLMKLLNLAKAFEGAADRIERHHLWK